MKYLEIISNGIKRLRKERNLTQEEFAGIIGMSVQGLRNIEQLKYQPTADTIDIICNAFEVTPYDLLIQPIPDDEQKKLITIIQKLKLCDKKQLDFIDGVINLLRNT